MFHIWCGGTFGSRLRGCGRKTPGRARGLPRGRPGSGLTGAMRNGSAGRAKLRLPTPRACVAGTCGLEPLTLNSLRYRGEETEDQSRGLERVAGLAW